MTIILTVLVLAAVNGVGLWFFRKLKRLTPYAGEPTEQEMDAMGELLEAELEFETLDELVHAEAPHPWDSIPYELRTQIHPEPVEEIDPRNMN